MTKEIFEKIYGQFFPAGNPSPFVDYIFNVLDVNKDGVVSFKEFITAISVTTHGSIDEKLNWAFRLYDIDSDGYVCRSEMLDIVTAIYRLHGRFDHSLGENDEPEQRVNQLFDKLDKDGDGKITCEEFCRGFKNDPVIVRALVPDDSSKSVS
ncbi:neuronal calcium sensor 1-like [Limulus polyphemus]|uniref:Neuronal calcium sensor 1-like n=1 Tax=Limulus polyphemus TaxID=6850 RepID=A0ABM1BNR0_LIMPO|nr:neuronal calcium sensor 1-like [Limulus polyphemus]